MEYGAPSITSFKVPLAAFLPLFFLIGSCQKSCNSAGQEAQDQAILAREGMCEEPSSNDIAALLPDGCKDKGPKAFPAIFAHFLAQSFPEGPKLEHILTNDIGRLECAPGPFAFAGGSEANNSDQRWNLDAVPNYFVLHLDGRKFSDESFYLVSQKNGLPIHCEYYKLQQNDHATLVLLPQAKMEPGQTYFLYLILSEGDARRTWIQPMQITQLAQAL